MLIISLFLLVHIWLFVFNYFLQQQGETAVTLATTFNDKVHALKLLMDRGVNFDHQTKVINVMIDAIFDEINVHSNFWQNGVTALMVACSRGKTDFAKILLGHGANMNLQNEVELDQYEWMFALDSLINDWMNLNMHFDSKDWRH